LKPVFTINMDSTSEDGDVKPELKFFYRF